MVAKSEKNPKGTTTASKNRYKAVRPGPAKITGTHPTQRGKPPDTPAGAAGRKKTGVRTSAKPIQKAKKSENKAGNCRRENLSTAKSGGKGTSRQANRLKYENSVSSGKNPPVRNHSKKKKKSIPKITPKFQYREKIKALFRVVSEKVTSGFRLMTTKARNHPRLVAGTAAVLAVLICCKGYGEWRYAAAVSAVGKPGITLSEVMQDLNAAIARHPDRLDAYNSLADAIGEKKLESIEIDNISRKMAACLTECPVTAEDGGGLDPHLAFPDAPLIAVARIITNATGSAKIRLSYAESLLTSICLSIPESYDSINKTTSHGARMQSVAEELYAINNSWKTTDLPRSDMEKQIIAIANLTQALIRNREEPVIGIAWADVCLSYLKENSRYYAEILSPDAAEELLDQLYQLISKESPDTDLLRTHAGEIRRQFPQIKKDIMTVCAKSASYAYPPGYNLVAEASGFTGKCDPFVRDIYQVAGTTFWKPSVFVYDHSEVSFTVQTREPMDSRIVWELVNQAAKSCLPAGYQKGLDCKISAHTAPCDYRFSVETRHFHSTADAVMICNALRILPEIAEAHADHISQKDHDAYFIVPGSRTERMSVSGNVADGPSTAFAFIGALTSYLKSAIHSIMR